MINLETVKYWYLW